MTQYLSDIVHHRLYFFAAGLRLPDNDASLCAGADRLKTRKIHVRRSETDNQHPPRCVISPESRFCEVIEAVQSAQEFYCDPDMAAVSPLLL